MPAYSFKEKFVPMILDGSKSHTIREDRKGSGHAKPGDTVFMYYGMRTKHCYKIGEGVCTHLNRIIITDKFIRIIEPDGEKYMDLIGITANKFAWSDGFRPEEKNPYMPALNNDCFKMMKRFFKITETNHFSGWIISWEKFVAAPPKSIIEKIKE